LESLKEAIINEDLSPAEFRAAFTQFRDQLARGLELRQELLQVGIDPNTPEGGREFDRVMFSGDNSLGVAAPVQKRTVGGKTYQKIDGEWFEVAP
jgi:hypothetical protein